MGRVARSVDRHVGWLVEGRDGWLVERPTAPAAAIEFESVARDLEVEGAGNRLGLAFEQALVERDNGVAGCADEVMVVAGGADGVAPAGFFAWYPLDQVVLGEKVECSEDGRATSGQAACLGLAVELVGAEVAAVRAEQLDQPAAWLGYPVAKRFQSADNLVACQQAHTIASPAPKTRRHLPGSLFNCRVPASLPLAHALERCSAALPPELSLDQPWPWVPEPATYYHRATSSSTSTST